MLKIATIIQARMGSSRLPGKVMLKICKKTVLEHVINRVEKSKLVDEIIIATTKKESDEIIVKEATRCGVKYFKGSEEDVLSRYYFAAKENDVDIIIRITSDCPLIDSHIIDEVIDFYLKNDYDIVTNAGNDLIQRTYPRGLDVEIFSLKALENAHSNAKEKYQREHVTPYIYENSEKIYYYKNEEDYSKHRWTLDTKEDFELINIIYNNLYNGDHEFYFHDILNFINNNLELIKINENIEQKKLK